MSLEKTTEAQLPNYEHVGGNIYIVRTQAGFKQARKHWGIYISGFEGSDTNCFPASYPSIVTFSAEYRGYHYANVFVMHLNAAFPIIQKHHQGKPMEENLQPYRVCANLDQLQKIGLDKKHDWKPQHDDKLPNRVEAKFSTKAEAIDVYNTLWRQQLVCFRNWID